jgi:hypothetical protein
MRRRKMVTGIVLFSRRQGQTGRVHRAELPKPGTGRVWPWAGRRGDFCVSSEIRSCQYSYWGKGSSKCTGTRSFDTSLLRKEQAEMVSNRNFNREFKSSLSREIL